MAWAMRTTVRRLTFGQNFGGQALQAFGRDKGHGYSHKHIQPQVVDPSRKLDSKAARVSCAFEKFAQHEHAKLRANAGSTQNSAGRRQPGRGANASGLLKMGARSLFGAGQQTHELPKWKNCQPNITYISVYII